jgi:hypothetical protein
LPNTGSAAASRAFADVALEVARFLNAVASAQALLPGTRSPSIATAIPLPKNFAARDLADIAPPCVRRDPRDPVYRSTFSHLVSRI